MGQKIVYAYVCGDILHKGHILHLENSKSLGDILIVGVLTDEAVMEKKKRPIIPFSERLEMVKSLKYVDLAVAQNEYSPIRNIQAIRPDILAESMSHKEEDIDNVRTIMNSMGGKVVNLPYFPNQSSTGIKEKIKK